MNGILYFECYSGISGDMAVAAMADLGADPTAVVKAVAGMELECDVSFSDTVKSGIAAKDFSVKLKHDNRDHDSGYLYGKSSGLRAHGEHRLYPETAAVLKKADMTENALGISLKILRILGEAEAEAHGIPLEKVHFHEVGATDSLADIAALGVCMDSLGAEKVCFSDLYEGTGTVRCQHGILPVPVPAVANIASKHGLRMKITDSAGEYVTPTGAAFAAATKNCGMPGSFVVRKTGIGAGKRESERSGILRAMILEPSEEAERIVKLECCIDDCGGEALGYASERLFSLGARDVFYTPVFMKKNRPAWLLTVVCDEDRRKDLEFAVFRETTTTGIRRASMERAAMAREIRTVETEYGPVRIKECSFGTLEKHYPEYEDLAKMCRERNVSYSEAYDAALRACKKP